MGHLVHWEIPSTDVQRSADFYRQMFGWEMAELNDQYIMFDDEGGVGGGISKVETMPAPAIAVYIDVDDIPAALARAESLGGTTARGRTEIGGDNGYFGELRDPCGCLIGIWSKT